MEDTSGAAASLPELKESTRMDHLTKFLVYNQVPPSPDIDYESLKRDVLTNTGKGIQDKRMRLLSPELDGLLEERIMRRRDSREVAPTAVSAHEERILYARNKAPAGARPALPPGEAISEELAIELRTTCFGSASVPTRGEWVRSPLVFRPAAQALAFGLLAPRNAARALLAALQAFLIKCLLFDLRPVHRDGKSEPPENYLRPSEERQEEALWRALGEVVWRCAAAPGPAGPTGVAAGDAARARIALPSARTYVQHSTTYYQDGITEKLHLYDFHNLEDLQIFIKRYLYMFQAEDGAGAMLLLYAAVLSRGCENVRRDLDGSATHVATAAGEGALAAVTLLLAGRATPYLHNGVVYVGDEDHYAMPQFGMLARSPVGLLLWYGGDDGAKYNANKQSPGSRLKTPALPIWVTCCAGHYGVLFNTNRELLRNYHAERRFDLTYYTSGGAHAALQVDTRTAAARPDDISATPLEKLVHTKWQDAIITWNGQVPNGTEDYTK